MRKLFFMLLIAAVSALSSQALTVTNTAGELANAIDDTQLTQLTVAGTMDARDFEFITSELSELTILDLSQVTITPIQGEKPIYGTVSNYRANEIPRTAFFGKKLTQVTLPSTLEVIGFAAFADCDRLTSVTFPASLVSLEDYAFSGTGLTSVELPATLINMGKGVFSRCESLTSATINSTLLGDFAFLGDFNLSQVNVGSNVRYILRGVFNGCTALTSINFDPACRINRIDEEAFINSGLQSIDLTTLGVGTIGDWAFAQTQLSSMQLPDGMTQLGEGALAHNELLTSVTLPGMAADGTPRRAAPGGPRRTIDRINDYTFAGDGNLDVSYLVREGVNYIGNYAFYNVSHEMDTMRLPSTIVYLGERAMAGMTGMRVLKTDATQVPELGADVWAGVDQPSIPLIAPNAESTELYKSAAQWENFFFDSSSGFILGDVNNDGDVTIADVTYLINYLLTAEGELDERAADLNGDGEVTISDVTALINYLLNGTVNMSMQRIAATLATQCSNVTNDVLSLPSQSIKPGETRTIDVSMNNVEHAYTAMQCEVILPKGMKLVGISGVNRGKDHSFYMRQHEVEENVYTIMAVSLGMNVFTGNEGEFMRLTITADEDFTARETLLTLANVALVTTRSEVFLAADAVAKVNDNSSVEQLNADKQIANVRYINVAGQESESPFNGVNIVITTYTDGTVTTSKVVK